MYLGASTASAPTPTGAEERLEGGKSDASKETGCSHNAGNVPPASIKSATVTHVRGKVNGIELGIVVDTGSATTSSLQTRNPSYESLSIPSGIGYGRSSPCAGNTTCIH